MIIWDGKLIFALKRLNFTVFLYKITKMAYNSRIQ
jgi:hypothetical protein